MGDMSQKCHHGVLAAYCDLCLADKIEAHGIQVFGEHKLNPNEDSMIIAALRRTDCQRCGEMRAGHAGSETLSTDDPTKPFDATERVEQALKEREFQEGLKLLRAMSWVRWREPADALPPKPEKYVVMVEEGGVAYLTTRSWSGSMWLNMNACEKVTEWLENLKTPGELRAMP